MQGNVDKRTRERGVGRDGSTLIYLWGVAIKNVLLWGVCWCNFTHQFKLEGFRCIRDVRSKKRARGSCSVVLPNHIESLKHEINL
jgi:hypothetical protein